METREAIAQIGLIRAQMAQAEVFRGYRSRVVAGTGAFAILAAGFQSWWLPRPSQQLVSYLGLWTVVAALCAAAAALEIWRRTGLNAHSLDAEKGRLAVEQLLPCLVAGASLTAVIASRVPAQAWMLPGLWGIVFSLGIFASGRLLPAAIHLAGVYYLLGGIFYLTAAASAEEARLAAWSMGCLFGGGQLLTAGILYWCLERQHG
jgi:hypothetical protein